MSTKNNSFALIIPTEVIVIILSYINDEYSTRRGELIKIINKKDERYKILKENLKPHISVDGGKGSLESVKTGTNCILLSKKTRKKT